MSTFSLKQLLDIETERNNTFQQDGNCDKKFESMMIFRNKFLMCLIYFEVIIYYLERTWKKQNIIERLLKLEMNSSEANGNCEKRDVMSIWDYKNLFQSIKKKYCITNDGQILVENTLNKNLNGNCQISDYVIRVLRKSKNTGQKLCAVKGIASDCHSYDMLLAL